ncbi:hypothetical protein [Streptomyces sp. NPDC057238]|uniref:hypothetical protein n=1 Tax=Streptomyces sp. NPDC057238 TaxID=3346060 RepID=UPI0036279E93
MEAAVVPVLGRLIALHARHFTARGAITAPAVLVGTGIAACQTMPWTDTSSAFRTDEFGYCWERAKGVGGEYFRTNRCQEWKRDG